MKKKKKKEVVITSHDAVGRAQIIVQLFTPCLHQLFSAITLAPELF
jgi:hypothetical protein